MRRSRLRCCPCFTQALAKYHADGSADVSLRRPAWAAYASICITSAGVLRQRSGRCPPAADETTTVAALVNEINGRDAKHILTIEDPIECEHAHQKSVVEQVEVRIDAPDFPTELRAALRQAPDVIVIGEMRGPKTMKIAWTAGETGHLVFSTLHTTDVHVDRRSSRGFVLGDARGSLALLGHRGLISAEEARTRTGHADELEGLLRLSSIGARRAT